MNLSTYGVVFLKLGLSTTCSMVSYFCYLVSCLLLKKKFFKKYENVFKGTVFNFVCFLVCHIKKNCFLTYHCDCFVMNKRFFQFHTKTSK